MHCFYYGSLDAETPDEEFQCGMMLERNGKQALGACRQLLCRHPYGRVPQVIDTSAA
jgi:hypothetical protein